jgi:CRISPR-associated protein Csb2
MLTIHVDLLTDRYAASQYNDRDTAEWPPHPARLFSALVEALHAAEGEEVDPIEAAALDALAGWDPPEVHASDASQRRVMTHFVPVNDVDQVGGSFGAARQRQETARAALADAEADARSAPSPQAGKRAQRAAEALVKADEALLAAVRSAAQPGSRGGTPDGAARLLPWSRLRQPRTFPAAVPTVPRVCFHWPEVTVEAPTMTALRRVAGRVVRLGHSSSFVHLQVDAAACPQDHGLRALRPCPDGPETLRVPTPEQRTALEAAFARHGGDAPGRVMPAAFQRYEAAEPRAAAMRTRLGGGRWLGFAVDPLPPRAAQALVEAVRGALLRHAPQPVHPVLSGHGANGPLAREHLHLLPLLFAGHPHADGRIRGFALCLPPGADPEGDRALLQAIRAWEGAPSDLRDGAADGPAAEVGFGGGRRLLARRVTAPEDALWTLQAGRWTGPARQWATVLPLALDGECAPLSQGDEGARRRARRTAEKLLRRAVGRALESSGGGSPDAPDFEVELLLDPPLRGAAGLRDLVPFQRDGHPRPRRLVHARVRFSTPVVGPLVLGAGRHFGLGLCAPVGDPTPAEQD